MSIPALFTPVTLGGVTTRNRIIISPMCTYTAVDGYANDWHLVHLGQYAIGGAGIVFSEATAVEPRGRISYADLGLWEDGQIAPLRKVTDFLKQYGAVPGVQLAHAGRKAGARRAWDGNIPLNAEDAARGEPAWPTIGPSAVAADGGWAAPAEMSLADIATVREAWRTATLRAVEAGFDAVDMHGAHGYLLHSFQSQLANFRTDSYGGDMEGRMRFPLEIAETVRKAFPKDKPVFYRVSAIDGPWAIEDSVVFARALGERGIDVIDCSSGGIASPTAAGGNIARGFGFQVPFAAQIRRDASMKTMAVGLITTPEHANEIVESGSADFVAIGREALMNPAWAMQAEVTLGGMDFTLAPQQYQIWLAKREPVLRKLRDES